MPALKKTLVLPVLDQEVAVDVDFRVIEIVERTFELSADAVITLLNDSRRVQRNKVADIVVSWLEYRELGLKRREIREYVMRAAPELLAVYVTSIYASLLFMLNYYDKKDPAENARKFDELMESDEWPKWKKDEDPDTKKKSGSKKTKRSSGSATA